MGVSSRHYFCISVDAMQPTEVITLVRSQRSRSDIDVYKDIIPTGRPSEGNNQAQSIYLPDTILQWGLQVLMLSSLSAM